MRSVIPATAMLLCAMSATAAPDAAEPLGALAKMPVKEVTVFKDGHAYVLHEGKMPTDARGNVLLDYLPTPVLGTFWPYSGEKNVRLSAVKASSQRVLVERTSLTIPELIEANPGADVLITDTDNKTITATIVGILTRSAEELEATSPPASGDKLPQKSNVVMLKTPEGTLAEPMERIKTVQFRGAYRPKDPNEEFRNLLTLKLEWPGGKPEKAADVGMIYLQKGIRWIPGYKVVIDGKGNATIRMQATLINEMVDLNDVTANLVIGVPTFAFKDTPDPISLQQTFAQLSQYFQADARGAFGMSNAIMTQTARMGEGIGGGLGGFGPQGPAGAPEAGPVVGGSEKSEDLYVFTVKHITLRKGERMVVPVNEFTLKYRDVYTLDMPFAPPAGIQSNVNTEQQAELARLLNAPKVIHKLRIANKASFPLTTAPALILNGDQLLGQGMMSYTPSDGDVDLPITTAVDVKVKKSDHETGRVANAYVWRGNQFARVDMAGTITLTNYRKDAVELEVNRYVLGHVDKADHDGSALMINPFEDADYTTFDRPYWWNWYSWPGYWTNVNGIGKFTWKLRLDPGKSVDLGYTWHYFWE